MEFDKIKFGKKLYAIRSEIGLTQAEIGKMLEITQSSYSKIELGETVINIDTLFKLATIFSITPESLIANDIIYTAKEEAELALFKNYLNYKRDNIVNKIT